MAARYDLREEPWLPVRAAGSVVGVGLRELFTNAHQYADLALASPAAASGLWRILAAFTARVTGLDQAPDGPRGWSKRRLEYLRRGQFDPDAFDSYVDRFGLSDRLFLFSDVDRPFLQDPRLDEQCAEKTAGINKLDMTRPAGQNPVWWSHHHDRAPQALLPADALFALITWLYYAPSTRCNTRHVNGTSDANMLSGPLRSALSYHPVADDLFASLILSVPGPTGWGTADVPDKCPWENAEMPDPLVMPSAPSSRGPCSLLTARTGTAVLLIPDAPGRSVVDCWVTWSTLRQLGLAPARDPHLIYTTTTSRDDTVRVTFRRADANRALWRDLDGLLLESRGDSTRPSVFASLGDLPKDVVAKLRVRAYGCDQDGQSRNRQWHTATTPAVLGLMAEHDRLGSAVVAAAHDHAEASFKALTTALRTAWKGITGIAGGDNPPPCPWLGDCGGRYWTLAETEFWRILDADDRDTTEHRFVHIALRVYGEITHAATYDPKGMKHVEAAKKPLLRLFPKKRKEETST